MAKTARKSSESKGEPAPVVTDRMRQRIEYTEGRRDFNRGEHENPHLSGDARTAWWMGYLDARTIKRMGPVLQRLGQSFP